MHHDYHHWLYFDCLGLYCFLQTTGMCHACFLTALTEWMFNVFVIAKRSQVVCTTHGNRQGQSSGFSWSFSPVSALGWLSLSLCLCKKSGYVPRCSRQWGRSQAEQERLVPLKKRLDFLDRTRSTGNTIHLSHGLYHACREADEFTVERNKILHFCVISACFWWLFPLVQWWEPVYLFSAFS